MSPPRATLLHVEDDLLWRGAVRAVLLSRFTTLSYHEAADARTARLVFENLKPNLVLLDLRLPDANGLELFDWFSLRPQAKLILLSGRKDHATLLLSREKNVYALLRKTAGFEQQLEAAVNAALTGHRYWSPEVLSTWHELCRDSSAFVKILSDREIALLRLLGVGQSDQEIGSALGISSYTARSHRHSIMAKLGLHRTPELIAWCIKNGFG